MSTAKVPLGIGKYDERGNPRIEFHLHGVKHDPPGPKVDGIIDTGFTGFLQIPLAQACSLGLPLEGTAEITLADSSKRISLTALAKVTLLGVTEIGTVILSPGSSDILAGMDFLRRFKRALVVSRNGILVVDDTFPPPANPKT